MRFASIKNLITGIVVKVSGPTGVAAAARDPPGRAMHYAPFDRSKTST